MNILLHVIETTTNRNYTAINLVIPLDLGNKLEMVFPKDDVQVAMFSQGCCCVTVSQKKEAQMEYR